MPPRVTVRTRSAAECPYSPCSSSPGAPRRASPVERAGPSACTTGARAGRASQGGGAPRETGGVAGDTGGPPEDRVIRQRSSRAQPVRGRPARRRGTEVGGPPAPTGRGATPAGPGPARRRRPPGWPGWDAGSGPRRRVRRSRPPVRPDRGANPAAGRPPTLPGRRFPGRATRGCSTGHAAPPPRPGPTARRTAAAPSAACRGARCWPPAAAWRMMLAFPGPALVPLAVLGPAALALAVHGRSARGGLWLGPGPGAGLLRAPAVAGPASTSAPFPWLALAVFEALHLALLGAATALTVAPAVVAAVGGRAVGGRRGAARTAGPRRLPLGPAGLQPDRRPAAVPRRLRGSAPGRLRRRPDRHAAGRRRARAGPRLASGRSRSGATGRATPARRRPRRARRRSRWSAPWPGCPLPGRLAHRGRADVDRRGDPGERAARRSGLQRPAPRRAGQPRAAHPRAGRRRGGAASSRSPTSSSGRRTARTSTPTSTPTPPGRSTGPPGPSTRRSWWAPSSQGPGRFISNTAIVWDPEDGPGETYVKRHPVPLGEYVPARSLLPLLQRARSTGSPTCAPGTSPACWTSAAPASATSSASRWSTTGWSPTSPSAGMLVVQTNNATFGRTAESEQQLADEPAAGGRARPHRRRGRDERHLGGRGPGRHRRPLLGAVHPRRLRRGDRPAGLAQPRRAARGRAGVAAHGRSASARWSQWPVRQRRTSRPARPGAT